MFYDWASKLSYIQCGHLIVSLNRNIVVSIFTGLHFVFVVVVVVLVVGAYQQCSHEGLLYSNPPPPKGVPSIINRGSAHQAA
jgi:hypothetical protein